MKPLIKRIKWKRIGGIALFIASAVFAAFAYQGGEPDMVEYHEEAEEGDTVWSMCARVASDRDDLSELVFETMRENNISRPGSLQPGQMVIIRVKAVTAWN